MDVKTDILPPTIHERRRSRIPSILLAIVAISGILWLISIQSKGEKVRVKSKEQWKSLMETHPFIPARDTDSRSPCPAINALANHGFLPRDGRHITADALFEGVVKLGLAPVAAQGFVSYAYHQLRNARPNKPLLDQFQSTLEIDLDHLTIYRVIEHDASLTRNDTAMTTTTAQKVPAFVERMIETAQDGYFTRQNEHDIRKIRWLESIRDNKLLHYRLYDQFFAAVECTALLEILGTYGNLSVPHLHSFIMEERIPDDWFPQKRTFISLIPSIYQCWYDARHSKATL